jgi:hypothetical protein
MWSAWLSLALLFFFGFVIAIKAYKRIGVSRESRLGPFDYLSIHPKATDREVPDKYVSEDKLYPEQRSVRPVRSVRSVAMS